jgi:transposase
VDAIGLYGESNAGKARRKFDARFREGGAAGPETGKPIAAIAPDLGANEGTLGNWVVKDAACKGARAVA